MGLQDRLENSAAGGAILFCGAGFSADCLSLSENEDIGTGFALLDTLNRRLEEFGKGPYKELANATDQFIRMQSEFSLFTLLRERFTLSHITDDMIDIVNFPWERIYTTNYDNAIQRACIKAGKQFKTLNNLDKPESIPGTGLEIVHLHGCVEKWTLENFRESCVLGTDSYSDAHRILRHWLRPLQADFDKSSAFVFVGFAMGDFHIRQVFYNSRDAHPKVFFINRPSAKSNPDLEMIQEKYGTSMSMSRSEFAGMVRNAQQVEKSLEPVVPSFRRYTRPDQAAEISSVEEIQNLFIYGAINRPQLIRDVSMNKSGYHIVRNAAMNIVEHIEHHTSPVLIYGEICCGKTLIVEEICARLAVSRPVFLAHKFYDSIVDESQKILSAYDRPVLIVENCFSMRPENLGKLLLLFQVAGPTLIMTSRSISARSDVSGFERLRSSVHNIHLTQLGEREIGDLVNLSDQAGGWIESPKTFSEKAQYIRRNCGGNLPGFMLEIMKSRFVRDRYAEEYRKIIDLCSDTEVKMMVAACYISHIGDRMPASFFSNMFNLDISDMLERLDKANYALRLVRVEDGFVETVPSIGARNILREIVPSHDRRLVVDTVVDMLKYLSQENEYLDQFEHRMFTQLMRYSVLRGVLEDTDETNRFFDHVSKIDYCRTRVLFWLQWHMAMVDQCLFEAAERYLQRGYTEAEKFDRKTGKEYDRIQLDDRKAKFLMIRGRREIFRPSMIRDVRDAIQIAHNLIRRQDLTHHPFDTFVEIVEFVSQHGLSFEESLREKIYANIDQLSERMRKRVRALDLGYPRGRGWRAIRRFDDFKRRITH